MKTWTLLAALLLSVFVSGQGVTQSIGGVGGSDGNGIYSGSNQLSSPTVVTQSGFRMTFTGGQFIAGDSTIVEIDQGKLSLIAPQEIKFHAPLVTFGPNASEWVPELAPDYLVGFDVTTGDWRRWPLDSVGGGGGSSNWQVNSGSITPLTATKLVMRDGATTTTNKLFDFRIPSNVVTANADTVGVIGWSSDGTAAEKRDIIFKSAAVSFRGPNPSFRINSTASDPNVTGGSFVQERNGALQHYIQSERADLVRWNFYNGANASKLGIAGWHANFGIVIGQYTTSNLAENDLMLLTRGVIGLQRKGVLFSPHTAAEMAAFTPTTEGTIVYNTTDNCYHLWDGAAWKSMCDVSGDNFAIEVAKSAATIVHPDGGRLGTYVNSDLQSIVVPEIASASGFGGIHSIVYLPERKLLFGGVRRETNSQMIIRFNDPLNDLNDYDAISVNKGKHKFCEAIGYSRLQDKVIGVFGDPSYVSDSIYLYEMAPDGSTLTKLTGYDGNDGFTNGSTMWIWDDTSANKTYIYVLEGSYTPELLVFDYDSPASPVATVNVSTDPNSLGHAIMGDGEQIFCTHAYGSPGFITRLSMTNPALPVKTQTLAVPVLAFTNDLVMVGDYVYAGTEADAATQGRLYRFNKKSLTDSVSYRISRTDIQNLSYDGEYIWMGGNLHSPDTLFARFNPRTLTLENFGGQPFVNALSCNNIMAVDNERQVYIGTSFQGTVGSISRWSAPRLTNYRITQYGAERITYRNGPVLARDYVLDEVAADVTATMYALLPVNCTAASRTITPPPSPKKGDYFIVVRSRGGGANTVTVDTSPTGLYAGAIDVTLTNGNPYVRLTYVDATIGWVGHQ